ncbi:hypothetical protein [Pseudomonas sp. NA-150]|uniref:hypothetical protein n=1 Tax=Pseudomonas sp. NA-150 TaxID=3367525 RepID=UPI0037CB6AF6
MDVKRIWRREASKRSANEARKDRVFRNWPIHAQRAVVVFNAFALEAKKHNVSMFVTEPEWIELANRHLGNQLGEFPIGVTSVCLRFGLQYTSEGLLTRTADGDSSELYIERGAELLIHHSPSDGVIHVFFKAPVMRSEPSEENEPLLYTHTHNTDVLTSDWLAALLPPFLTFNRVESVLERPSIFDSLQVRWWRFRDIRNRRGYLKEFQHILTPWELLILAAIVAIPGALIFSLVKFIMQP